MPGPILCEFRSGISGERGDAEIHTPYDWLQWEGREAQEILRASRGWCGRWGIEARNAAIANGFYVGAINRVGTEVRFSLRPFKCLGMNPCSCWHICWEVRQTDCQ